MPFKVPIIYRYVLREIAAPFLITLFTLTGLLFLIQVLKLMELVVDRSVPFIDILRLFSYVVPQFLELAIPMAVLIGVIVALGRLSADSEIVAMRSSGIPISKLSRPIFFFSSFVFVGAIVTTFYLAPWANYRLGQGLFELAKSQATAGLSSGVFNDFGKLTIYAEGVTEESRRLLNIVIEDKREADKERVIIANHGQVVPDDSARKLMLRLFDGSIYEGRTRDFNLTYFDINTLELPHSELADDDSAMRGKKAREMPGPELFQTVFNQQVPVSTDLEAVQERRQLRLEIHRRIAFVFVPFLVAVVALALGVQPSRASNSWGGGVSVGIGIIVIIIYYVSFAFLTALAEQGLMPAVLSAWIPNALLLGLGLYMFHMVREERWSSVSQALGNLLAVIGHLRK
ncbi:MAG: LPS export ABC transporter permease LptF [bacterium]|nr:LPS export ABC transporter permease LptF [bacterium]